MKRGFSLVEIIVGAAIISTSFIVLANLQTDIVKLSHKSLARIQAGLLAEEGIVAVKSIDVSTMDNNTA